MKTKLKTTAGGLSFKKKLQIMGLALSVVGMEAVSAQTFQLGDNLAADGSGVVVGTPGTPNSPTEVETSGNYRQSDGVAGNPSFYNAIMVGSNYGGTDLYRSVITFDVSALPVAPAGFFYELTDMSLILEVSGGNTMNQRPATLIDFYEGSFATGSLPSVPDASVLFDSPDGTFITTSLGVPILDLSTDSTVSITLDAPNAASNPGGNFYTFGSGKGPNIGFGGTSAIQKAPELVLSYNLVAAAVPEPSSALLLLSGLIGALGFRRRA